VSWADERRQDRVSELRTQAEIRESALRLQAELAAGRTARRETARKTRKAERAEARQKRSEHTAEFLIYPMAVVCAAMAVPAMASYGHRLYGDWTGAGLPVLSELGMWAFAGAVAVSQRKHPQRSTVGFTVGIVVFAAVGAVLNFLHGIDGHHGIARGVVMAIVSVAGVVAHQLVVARPPRSRAERAAARLDRLAARRLTQARRTAIRRADIDLAGDGSAALVYTPGRVETAAPRLRVRRVALSPVRELRAWRRQVLAATDPDITRVLNTLGVTAAQTALSAVASEPETAVLPGASRPDLVLPAASTETFEAPELASVVPDEMTAVSRPAVPSRNETSRSGTSRTAVGETSPGRTEPSRSASRSGVSRTAVGAPGADGDGTSRPTGTTSRRAEMTAWVLQERAAGRDPSGADLDREFGTRDYGRTVLRALRDAQMPAPAAGTARDALDAARARAARDTAVAESAPAGLAVADPLGSGERDATATTSDSGAVPAPTASERVVSEPAVLDSEASELVGARS
jgi:hypothetical protein